MASPFASRTTKVVPLPFDEPHTVTIQKLAGRHLETAHELMLAENAASLQRLGGIKVQHEIDQIRKAELKAAKEEDRPVADPVEKVKADPMSQYDRTHVLYRGIKAWTYDEPLKPVPIVEEGVTRMHIPAIDDLTEEAADFLAREILALTLPPRDEAEQKNA